MPIFWLTRLVIGGGRSRSSAPRQKASIEIAASWPCATAVMMFLGPNAASPPKKTCRRLDWKVTGSTVGQAVAAEGDARVALDPGKSVLLADRDQHVVAFDRQRPARQSGVSTRRPRSSFLASIFSNTTPVRRPASCVNALGARKFRIATPSRIASSFSQGEAFISAKPERTTTLTSAPPRRRAVRQQSIAVLPPPSTTTRRPIDETWPNETLDSQSMPIWMWLERFAAPRNVEVAPARRAAADENRVVAFADQALEAVDAPFGDELAAGRQSVADLLVDHLVGQAKLRDLAAHHAAGARNRNRTPRPRSRSRPDRAQPSATPGPRRRRRRACRCARRRAGQQRGDVLLVIGGDALEPADRDRLFLEPSPAAGGLARTVACAPQNPREHIRLPIDHIGVVVVARRDLADIFGDRGVRRARPLTVDDFVKVVRDRRRPSAPRRFVLPPVPEMPAFRSPCLTSYANLRTKLLKSALEGDKRS